MKKSRLSQAKQDRLIEQFISGSTALFCAIKFRSKLDVP